MGSVKLSDIEAWTVDQPGVVFVGAGCIEGGPVGCLSGLGAAWSMDFALTTTSPLGIAENFLGIGSFALTAGSDLLSGNTNIEKGLIGRDTLVSGRNALLSLFPASNVNALISNSQLKYDLDRLSGIKASGSINLTNPRELFHQLFLNDWW